MLDKLQDHKENLEEMSDIDMGQFMYLIETGKKNPGLTDEYKTRDYKIVTSFFNTMANTKYITGTISNMDKNGTGNVLLKMNELEIEKNFNWELDKNNFEFYLKTSINVFDWGAQAALDALNEVCLEQHTGPDGINKLWPDVDITVIAAL